MDPEAASVLPLTTRRLVLRDLAEEDEAAVHALRGDPAVTHFMRFGPETPDQSRAWLAEVVSAARERPRSGYNLAIVRRADDDVLGWVGIGASSRHPGVGELGFGYMLRRDAWGHGYGTEAARAAVRFGFEALGARRVSAWCDALNVASARVLAKAGLRLERRYQDTDPGTGRMVDCLEYALRADEWR